VARGLTRLVGREAALASVRQALERAMAGQGQVVAVLGEAGVGKSRLVHECLQQLNPQGWQVLTSAALSYTQATPYFPVVTLLKRYFHLDDGMTPPRIQATFTAQVQALDARLQDAVPALLALLDALPPDDLFWQLDPVQRRVRILDALKRLLVRLSQTQPVVLVVEDLHWLDTETQTCLDRLVDSLPAVPLLLLGISFALYAARGRIFSGSSGFSASSGMNRGMGKMPASWRASRHASATSSCLGAVFCLYQGR
jgi:predicted ATPase